MKYTTACPSSECHGDTMETETRPSKTQLAMDCCGVWCQQGDVIGTVFC